MRRDLAEIRFRSANLLRPWASYDALDWRGRKIKQLQSASRTAARCLSTWAVELSHSSKLCPFYWNNETEARVLSQIFVFIFHIKKINACLLTDFIPRRPVVHHTQKKCESVCKLDNARKKTGHQEACNWIFTDFLFVIENRAFPFDKLCVINGIYQYYEITVLGMNKVLMNYNS